MKALSTLVIVALICSFALADEATVNLDRLAFLVPPHNQQDEFSSRVAIHFSLPEEVVGKNIIYAELHVALDFSDFQIVGDSILELEGRNITSDWSDQANWNNPWTEPGGDLDTLSFYSYSLKISPESEMFMDVSQFVKSVAEDGQTNYGLMLMPYKHDLPAFHMRQNLVARIRELAQVKIVCR